MKAKQNGTVLRNGGDAAFEVRLFGIVWKRKVQNQELKV